jgi:hypothetical protein
MESPSQPTNNNMNMGQRPNNNKNVLIGVLIFLLILSFLGINLLGAAGGFVESISKVFGPFFRQILSLVGYTAGTAINKVSEVATDTATVGVELAGGAVHNVGDLLVNASKENGKLPSLDIKINSAPMKLSEPSPDNTENPIQNAPAASKKSWCLVGEYQGRRGCIEVSEQDKCISGQVFPEQKMCLNPTLTQNAVA